MIVELLSPITPFEPSRRQGLLNLLLSPFELPGTSEEAFLRIKIQYPKFLKLQENHVILKRSILNALSFAPLFFLLGRCL